MLDLGSVPIWYLYFDMSGTVVNSRSENDNWNCSLTTLKNYHFWISSVGGVSNKKFVTYLVGCCFRE